MKISKFKIFLIVFVSLYLRPEISVAMRLLNMNLFRDVDKKQDFYSDSFTANTYEIPEIRTAKPSWDAKNNLLEQNTGLNNNILLNYNSNTNNDYKSRDVMRVEERPRIMQQVSRQVSMNPVLGIRNCPCIEKVKCQPCGITPVLKFPINPAIDCPCAPKLNCPVCPPLSLIHEIASKKV